MIAGFLRATSHNLRYVGIDALARVTRINAKYAAEHQLAVVDCLEDPDDTLKKKTLELLFKMTKPGNVEVRLKPMIVLRVLCSRASRAYPMAYTESACAVYGSGCLVCTSTHRRDTQCCEGALQP